MLTIKFHQELDKLQMPSGTAQKKETKGTKENNSELMRLNALCGIND